MRPRDGEGAEAFEEQRPRLLRLAYRMLGSVTEAEDIVQEAYLRWHGADRAAVREPAAFLSRMVARLCLDHLKSARVRRETYIGPWLPEPVTELGPDGDDDLSFALMLALERLSPLERAAFLLHDVFGMGFEEVAAALDRDPAACRQLAARARRHVREARPRFAVSPDEGRRVADAFLAASRSGDVAALRDLLAENVIAYADGGGLRAAALNPLRGFRRVAGLLAGIARKARYEPPQVLYAGPIDGLPGFLTRGRDGVLQSLALQIEEGRITALYIVRNPEKLGHLAEAAGVAVS
ncbi:sigma-70 family RNA polymerase sigma factor [Microvirga thermotolerans]|uniref:Sigma-70 family RNA polymerase sigma factor n=1 Tax=Microvirga thermotolerans TaxID=2651334 RepID=A0A5P9JR31_9HYPH|nr:sigma-70 family RNA polymerase sigma factor [Microvirga thermotolerans]QFU15097.1 sigma-70 family RNA polymerase sigma factor [Microvirga thermotolerans]